MVNSLDGPGGCACIPGPGHSVTVQAVEEYRKFTRPFLLPACDAVSAQCASCRRQVPASWRQVLRHFAPPVPQTTAEAVYIGPADRRICPVRRSQRGKATQSRNRTRRFSPHVNGDISPLGGDARHRRSQRHCGCWCSTRGLHRGFAPPNSPWRRSKHLRQGACTDSAVTGDIQYCCWSRLGSRAIIPILGARTRVISLLESTIQASATRRKSSAST
jgi:hypothetical protein